MASTCDVYLLRPRAGMTRIDLAATVACNEAAQIMGSQRIGGSRESGAYEGISNDTFTWD